MRKNVKTYKDSIKIKRLLYERVAINWFNAYYGTPESLKMFEAVFEHGLSVKSSNTSLLCDFWREVELEFNVSVSYKNKEEMLKLINQYFGYNI